MTTKPLGVVSCPGCGVLHASGHEDSCACDHCLEKEIRAVLATMQVQREIEARREKDA